MNIDKDRKKLESLINQIFSNEDLIHIFKDLIWGIIRLKEEKNPDAIKNFGECCEHSHEYLFFSLRRISPIQVDLVYFPKTKDWEVNEKLQDDLFPLFDIKNINLLKYTREIVEKWNSAKHEFKKGRSPVFKSIDVLLDCVSTIRLVLILSLLFKIQKRNYGKSRSDLRKEIQLKKIKIENEFLSLLNQNDEEIIEFFLDTIFSRNIRNLLFQKSILDSKDILNSKVLQKYLPYYVFNHWRIEKILSETMPLPFRAVGPHIADFEKGDWIFIPKLAKYIFKLLKKNKKSTLISAVSGTGKTVISRWIGFKFYKMGYSVFYIDCLDHKSKKIETVLDQIIIQHESAKKLRDTLFIFDNIHILDKELRIKLNECKDINLILLTERIFEGKQKEKENFGQYFGKFEKIEISKNHWSYRNTIKGIIQLNTKNTPILNQIKYIGNENLWIYAIILKLFKKSLEIKQDSSIIEIFTDFDLIGDSITEYFEELLKTKIIKFKSSEFDLYLNHINYFLGILSLYSEYELWTDRGFIEHLFSIKDTPPLGTLNSRININKEILTEIESFMIDIFEISRRTVDLKPSIKELEFKIPHSQMAIIYKNCILRKFEKSYPNLIEQLNFLYISYGKYFGSFLQQKHSYLIREGKYTNFELINKRFFDFDSYLKSLNHLKKLEILQNQIINNSIEESDLFFYYISLYSNSLEEELFRNIFQEESVLFNHSWKSKIEESKSSYLYLFLRRIKKYLGVSAFIDFVEKFQLEIFNTFKQDRGDYIFSFLNFFLPLNYDLWAKVCKNISDLIDQTSLNMDDLFSIYSRNRKFFENIPKGHKFYSIVKKILSDLILKISFEQEKRFVPSLYYNYGDLFSQIYNEVIEQLLTQPNQELRKVFEIKLRNSDLIRIINYLKDYYENNPNIAMRFFKKFLEIIKMKLYEADVDNIETFFDVLCTFFKEEKEFIKGAFLSDWEWFEGIFLRLSDSEFFHFSRFRIIDYFFEGLFPEYLEDFKKFFMTQTKMRIQEHYDSLECKIDIIDKLTVILEDEINDFILSLFNKAIYDSLEFQDLSFYAKTFQKLHVSHFLKEKWDFKKFILSNDFKEKLVEAENTELKNFFNIFWKGEQWRKILFDNYKNLLTNRFGQDYEFNLNLEEDYENRLRKIVVDLDLLEIIKHYNHYNDPFFGKKESYVFSKLRKNVQENSNLFLGVEFKTKLNSLDFPNRFNLLLIFIVYHPSILNEFCNRNNIVNLKYFNKSEDILEVITILEFYKLKFDILKELDETINGEISLFEVVLETIKKIDLASLRYLIQINPAGLLNEYTNIELSNHLKNSSLLQLSIFLYKPELNIALKILGHTYIRKISFMGGPMQKYPFVLELPEGELKLTKDKINFVLWLEERILKPKREGIFYSRHSDLITKIISEEFTPFSSYIINLIKQSNVRDIAIYFKSLTKILNDIDQIRFEIPEELEKYLISEDFKNKIDNAKFYDIYRLFKYLKMISFNLSREVWIRNRNIFEHDDFSHKVRRDYIYRIFKFYDMFNNVHFKFNQEAINILKKIMNIRPLETIISYFLEILSNDDFKALLSVFKDEIIKIGKKYSKFELKRMLSESFMRKYNSESLNTMQMIFQERLNEKYFFES